MANKFFILLTVVFAAITLGTTKDAQAFTPGIGRDLILLFYGMALLACS